jgi:hypothetical protein
MLAMKIKSPLLRSKEAGTNALNAYHLVGQLVSLYSQAAKKATDDEVKIQWNESIELLIGNVGDLYNFWSALRKEGDYGLAPPESVGLTERIFKLSHRFNQISQSIQEWTPACRLISIFLKCESRWQSILNDFKKENADHSEVINRMLADSRQRVRVLRAVLAIYGKSEATTPELQAHEMSESLEIMVDDF